MSWERRSAADRSFRTAAISAATPLTCGAAIEVPLFSPQPPSAVEERMSVPGAASAIVRRPKFE